jgi:hypothetical protein
VKRNRGVDPETVQEISTWPAGTDKAPNLVALVQSSLSVIAIAITAPELIWMLGPSIEKFRKSGLSKASVAPRTLLSSGAGPSRLQEQVVGAAQCPQPAFDGVLGVLGAWGITQALRGDGAHRGQGILDAVMKLFQDQLLKFVGRLALLGGDTGLSEQ